MQVSFYKNTFSEKVEIPVPDLDPVKVQIHYKAVPLNEVFRYIKNGHWEHTIDLIKKRGYKEHKVNLPCFTPSGVFNFRTANMINSYSGIVSLDFDDIKGSVFDTKELIKQIPETYAVFFSPSLRGLKVFVRVNTSVHYHKQAFEKISKYYEKILNQKTDKACSDVTRLCYISFDRDLYANTDSKIFNCYPQTHLPENINIFEVGKWLIKHTESHPSNGAYVDGNRHKFIYALACNCNRFGMTYYDALQLCQTLNNSDTQRQTEAKIQRSVQYAYNNVKEFATFNMPRL